MGTIYINDDNYQDFYVDFANKDQPATPESSAWIAVVSNLSPILILEHSVQPVNKIIGIQIELPSIDVFLTSSGNATRADLEYCRGFIGSSIIIYNYTPQDVVIKAINKTGENGTFKAENGDFIKMSCKLGYIEGKNGLGGEFIYWEQDIVGKAIMMTN
jgi:hypothetical protein